ncbi:MAG: aromatic ring-hydroxylating dioxygenase subunit alpha [Acidimicrobiia bacterium]|nr:aromatic ring-hydroxylating dioxygenase subunit alpha [Acidimicrobiia bacterium]
MGSSRPTLTGTDYTSPDVYDREIDRIFRGGWACIGHQSGFGPRSRRVLEVAGERIIVTGDEEGRIHALANVCRHRGSELCDPTDPTIVGGDPGPKSIRCPYHAWTYSLDGSLVATPRVDEGDIDLAANGLHRYPIEVVNGLVFVSLGRPTMTLDAWLDRYSPDAAAWLRGAEFDFTGLHLERRTATRVAANWKIIVENYLECLHCPVVHPELVDVIPLYRTGRATDPDRDDGAVALTPGANSFSADGQADLPLLPGFDADNENLYVGHHVFPNLFVDVTSTSCIVTVLFPDGAGNTMALGDYLFAPEAPDQPDFDPDTVIDFSELVGHQDYDVCERVQRGVRSATFDHGILTAKDREVATFDTHYRQALEPVDWAARPQ